VFVFVFVFVRRQDMGWDIRLDGLRDGLRDDLMTLRQFERWWSGFEVVAMDLTESYDNFMAMDRIY